MNRRFVILSITIVSCFFNYTAFSAPPDSYHTSANAINPLVEQILKKIDKDSCNTFLRELCTMFTRDASNTQWNKGVLVPYLEKKFKVYGCDSVYQVPVSGYDAPVVVGVKKGKKNPSTQRFVLIGAHPDNTLSSGTGRHQGANDNASGSVGFLEAARVMQHFNFENTIVYAGLNCEEHGLAGSKELFKRYKDAGCQIIGSVVYDMLGIRPNTGKSMMFDYYSGIAGCKAFADSLVALTKAYNATPYTVNIEAASTIDIPTDAANIWKNGFIGITGMGGSGQGSIHTKADSIGNLFDSTHLPKVVGPGIALIAHYAVPFEEVGTGHDKHFTGNAHAYLELSVNAAGVYSILYKTTSGKPPERFRIYTCKGLLVQTLEPQEKSFGTYKAEWSSTNTINAKKIIPGVYLIRVNGLSERFVVFR